MREAELHKRNLLALKVESRICAAEGLCSGFFNRNQSVSCAAALPRRSMVSLFYRTKYLEAHTASPELGVRQWASQLAPTLSSWQSLLPDNGVPSVMPLCLGGTALADLEYRRGAVASRRKGNTEQESLLVRKRKSHGNTVLWKELQEGFVAAETL